MKIEKVRKCGAGIEIKIDGYYYWFSLDVTEEEIKNHILHVNDFDNTKFNKLKALEGKDI